MNSDLMPTTHPNRVKTAMGLQARVDALDSSAPSVDGLPLRRLDGSCHGLLVSRVGVNVRTGFRVVVNDVIPYSVGGIGRISNNVPRPEVVGGVSRLPQKRCSPLGVVDVPCGHIDHKGQFVGGIAEDVGLVAPDVLLIPLSVGFDNPSSVLVRRAVMLPAVRPCLDVGRVYGDRLPDVGKRLVELARECPQDTPHVVHEGRLGEFRPEAGEGRLAGDCALDAASPGDVRVIVEQAHQVGDGGQAQVVEGDKASPENLGSVALRPTSSRALQTRKQARVGECGEYGLKFRNDRRGLRQDGQRARICDSHLEEATFRVVRGRRVLSTPSGPALFS